MIVNATWEQDNENSLGTEVFVRRSIRLGRIWPHRGQWKINIALPLRNKPRESIVQSKKDAQEIVEHHVAGWFNEIDA